MLVIDFLIYMSAVLLLLLLTYLIISFFPQVNKKIKFFNRDTPIYERVTFYVSSLVSVVSLIIALKTYNDAVKISEGQNKINDSTRVALEKVVKMIAKQTQTLDTSRVALQNVVKLSQSTVKLSTIQQKILDANLIVSTEQLKIIKDKNNEERIKSAYKPNIVVTLYVDTLRYTEKSFVKVKGYNWFYVNLSKSYLNKKVFIKLGLVNIGKVSAKGTIVLLTPLLAGSDNIEKISGKNPINDHFSNELKVDVAEFYDYYSLEIPPAQTYSVFNPEYRFNFTPIVDYSAIKVNVNVNNGIDKIFVIFITLS